MTTSHIFNYFLVFELILWFSLKYRTARCISRIIQALYTFTVILVELSVFYGIYLAIIDIVSIHRVVI